MSTIRKRNNKFQVQVRLQGKLISKTFTLKSDALKWSREIEVSIENGSYSSTIKVKVKLEELLYRYKDEVLVNLKSYPVEKYKIPLVAKHLGEKELSEVTTAVLVKYREHRLKEVSNQTVKHELGLVRRVLTKGIEWGYDITIPFVTMPSLKGQARNRRLTKGEIGRLLTNCDDYFRNIVVLLMNTGIRRGELAKIALNDIDLESKTIKLYDTKNGDNRTIPLSSVSLNAVKYLINTSIFNNLVNYKADRLTERFKVVCRKSEIDDYRLHDLRHEAVSRLFERGLNMMEVSTISGHKDLASLKRYTHINPTSLLDRLG